MDRSTLTQETENRLRQEYLDAVGAGSYGGVSRLYAEVKDRGISRAQVKEFLAKQDAYTLHKPVRKKFPTRRVYVTFMDEQWEIDLIDLSKIAKYNDKNRYILSVIDVLSKHAWAEPIKSKSADDVLDAFGRVLDDGRKPVRVYSDKGTEFTNRKFRAFLEDRGIGFYTATSNKKASVVERFNRTIKQKMFRYFTANNTLRYVEALEDLLVSYNESVHRSIGMAPIDVTNENQFRAWNALYAKSPPKPTTPKYRVGDRIRLAQTRSPFAKGYEQGWTQELFTVSKRLPGYPPTYRVADYNGEVIDGLFYEPEMARVIKEDDVYLVEKVIRKRKKNGRVQLLVKWKGYPDSMNSWVDRDDVQEI